MTRDIITITHTFNITILHQGIITIIPTFNTTIITDLQVGQKTCLDLCVSSLRRGHANLLCIIPILSDDPRRESKRCLQNRGLGIGKHMVHTSILPTKTLQFANLQPSKPNSQRHHVDIHSSPCNLCKHLHLLLL